MLKRLKFIIWRWSAERFLDRDHEKCMGRDLRPKELGIPEFDERAREQHDRFCMALVAHYSECIKDFTGKRDSIPPVPCWNFYGRFWRRRDWSGWNQMIERKRELMAKALSEISHQGKTVS